MAAKTKADIDVDITPDMLAAGFSATPVYSTRAPAESYPKVPTKRSLPTSIKLWRGPILTMRRYT
jgi:hypothetical protein